MKHQFILRISALSLAAVAVMGAVSALASQGSSSDPLVTLSYLTDVVTPQLLSQVDTAVAENEQSLVSKINALVDSADAGGTQGTFSVVSLSSGQVLTPEIGCELLLRIGSAYCSTSASPGLIDTTAGGTLNNGDSLTANHLYLTTITGRSIHATSSVKIMVKGDYTIS